MRCHATRVALEVGHGLRVLLEAEVCVAAYQVEPAEAIFLLGAAHFVQDLLCHGKRCSRIGVKQLAARVALPFLLRTVGQRRTVAGTPLRCVCSGFAALGHQTIGGEHKRQLERHLGGRRSRKVALALAREQCEGEAVHPECRLAYLKRKAVGKLLRRCALQVSIAQRLHALGEELGQPLQRMLRVADAINQVAAQGGSAACVHLCLEPLQIAHDQLLFDLAVVLLAVARAKVPPPFR